MQLWTLTETISALGQSKQHKMIIWVGEMLAQEGGNMIFKPMPLEEAKELYDKLKVEPPSTLVKIAMEDIWFFTDGLKKNYGRVR